MTLLWGILFSLIGVGVVKLFWVAGFSVGVVNRGSQRSTRDLDRRSAYLIQQVVDQPVNWRERLASRLWMRYLPEQFRSEWALVTHSMTAACLTNLAFLRPEGQPSAQLQVERLIERVRRPVIKAFDTKQWGIDPLDDLNGERGHIGYLGHLNFMLAAYHTLGGSHPELRSLFTSVSVHLAGVLHGQPSVHGETYPGETYIPDNAVAVASLAIYDRLYPAEDTGVPRVWLDALNDGRRDPDSDLPVFSLDERGLPLAMSRGSACAWTIFYLGYIDVTVAQADYERLRKHFWRSYAPGLAAIDEYLGGKGDESHDFVRFDPDCGPLLWGMSPAATGFAIAGARFAGDLEGERQLVRTAEMAGFSVQWGRRRRYATAPLVGNAILPAMRSATTWDERWATRV